MRNANRRVSIIAATSGAVSTILVGVVLDPANRSMNIAAILLYGAIVCLVWLGLLVILVAITGGMPKNKS